MYLWERSKAKKSKKSKQKQLCTNHRSSWSCSWSNPPIPESACTANATYIDAFIQCIQTKQTLTLYDERSRNCSTNQHFFFFLTQNPNSNYPLWLYWIISSWDWLLAQENDERTPMTPCIAWPMMTCMKITQVSFPLQSNSTLRKLLTLLHVCCPSF